MNLLTLADRKANMMLRLNSLLITGMVLFFKNVIEYHDMAMTSVIIFLLTLFASLIFAILATKPASETLTTKNILETTDSSEERMFLFFHYYDMNQKKFEKTFTIMMNNPSLVYKNMALALHTMSKILMKRYRLSNISYGIFVGGFALSILSLLIVVWLK